ncbi:MAG: NAD-dependent succinate-semialdehyde dehydrogenase [Leptospiraceae bacterium]|nr:NAD-dependent succinate-semialdehyde dehydrogenase [Leptospiraceae bacterium]
MTWQSINPATEDVIREYPGHSDREVDQILNASVSAFQDFSRIPIKQRAEWLRAIGGLLESKKEELGQLMTAEMGKPITQSRAEIEKCKLVCDYFADNAEDFLQPRQIENGSVRKFVEYDPLGPILAIMPWNFPFWQVFRFAAPNLMAGNTALLKHAPNVGGCAQAIESLFRQAGYPPGCFHSLVLSNEATEKLIGDDRIQGVTLTGSETAGRRVAARAGEAIKKSVLELGGSDPCIILADADLDAAAETAAQSRMLNSGQSCIAAKRFIVVADVYTDFLERFARHLKTYTPDAPTQNDCRLGPMARSDLRDKLHEQCQTLLKEGARLHFGAQPVDGRGYFYEPTLFSDVSAEMLAAREEIFGPVASVFAARDSEHAIELANQTRYGLGAALWTRDLDNVPQLIHKIQAGAVFVNSLVRSEVHVPFGGVKASGYGRELAPEGIREFMNWKSVVITAGG